MNTVSTAPTMAYVYRSASLRTCLTWLYIGRKPFPSEVSSQRQKLSCLRLSFFSDIKLLTPAGFKVWPAKQYYAKFSVGDTARSTESAKRVKNITSWDSIFYL